MNFYSRDIKTKTVGLINSTGEFNCFLNTAVQALYFIFRLCMKGFKNALMAYECLLKDLPNCLLCDLQRLFSSIDQAITGDQRALDIRSLRLKLAEVYKRTGEFSIGSSADSMEALVHILTSLHCICIGDLSQCTESEGSCYMKCPSHIAANLFVLERYECVCGRSQELKWNNCSFVHQFYVNEVLEECKKSGTEPLLWARESDLSEKIGLSSVVQNEGRMAEFMRKQWDSVEIDICVFDECKYKRSRRQLILTEFPVNFVVNLIWDNRPISQLEILQVLSSISLQINIGMVYCDVSDKRYTLKGIVLYGLSHYIFVMRANKRWYKIDDEKLSVIESGRWFDTVKHIVQNAFKPTGLIYTESDKTITFDVPAADWIGFELMILTKTSPESHPIGSSYRVIPNGAYSSTFVQGYKKILLPNTKSIAPSYWKCQKCLKAIHSSVSLCHNCLTLQPGLSGWPCPTCTFLNKKTATKCQGCRRERSSHWKCKICKQDNLSTNKICLNCNHSMNSKASWECDYCSRTNPETEITCWNCAEPIRALCSKCKLLPVSPGKIYCLDCFTVLICKQCSSREIIPGKSACFGCSTPSSILMAFFTRQSYQLKEDSCVLCHSKFLAQQVRICRVCKPLSVPSCSHTELVCTSCYSNHY